MSKRLIVLASLFLYSFSLLAKTVVISDIDDTLKKSNSMGKPVEQAYHFLRKIPYMEMRDLFSEIKRSGRQNNEETKFYYVSAAYQFTFNAQAWISKYQFPAGYSYLKTKENKAPTYDFKMKTIQRILDEERKTLPPGETLTVYMFGDNAQFDAQVYKDLDQKNSLKAHIYIRDVRTISTYFDSTLPVKKDPAVKTYFSEMELSFDETLAPFMTASLKQKIKASYQAQTLIPEYTLKTLERRLMAEGVDKARARDQARAYWQDYYHRY